MRKLTLASAILVLLVAGCGSGVTKDATYETADSLRGDLQKAGLPCDEWSDEDTTGEFDAGECDGMQLRVYETKEALIADAEGILIGATFSALEAEKDTMIVSNQNWIAYVPAETAKGIVGKMGGEAINPADFDLAEILLN